MAVDALGQAHVTGSTTSPNFPLARPLQPALNGSQDAFATKLGADGGILAYSTYLGGSTVETGEAIAVDTGGNAYLTGLTSSSDFPTVAPFQPAGHAGGWDGFVAKIVDDASAPGPTPLPADGRVEDNDPAVHYTEGWYLNEESGHSGGTAFTAMDAGSRTVFTFRGTGVRWIGLQDEWSGIARVYVDGIFRGTVDTYASPTTYQVVLFTADSLTAGEPHTLVLEATGTHNPSSAASWVWVDAFDVTPDPLSAPRRAAVTG